MFYASLEFCHNFHSSDGMLNAILQGPQITTCIRCGLCDDRKILFECFHAEDISKKNVNNHILAMSQSVAVRIQCGATFNRFFFLFPPARVSGRVYKWVFGEERLRRHTSMHTVALSLNWQSSSALARTPSQICDLNGSESTAVNSSIVKFILRCVKLGRNDAIKQNYRCTHFALKIFQTTNFNKSLASDTNSCLHSLFWFWARKWHAFWSFQRRCQPTDLIWQRYRIINDSWDVIVIHSLAYQARGFILA